MAKWIYDDPNPGELRELGLVLEPHQVFEAPENWEPYPLPHPVYKRVDESPIEPDPELDEEIPSLKSEPKE